MSDTAAAADRLMTWLESHTLTENHDGDLLVHDGDDSRTCAGCAWQRAMVEVFAELRAFLGEREQLAARVAELEAERDQARVSAVLGGTDGGRVRRPGRRGREVSTYRVVDEDGDYYETDGDPAGLLAAATARAEQAEAIVARVSSRMTEYDRHGSGMVNVRQVINLLSPTWPDGNYSSEEPT